MKKIAGKTEKGAVTIVEATFVFPIVFFIVFFMIMAGEAYYQYARVEHAVTAAAINGAARAENPMLSTVISNGSVPTDPTATDVMPYRYIFTSEASSIASEIQGELEKTINSMRPLLFRNMSPDNVVVTIKPKMNPLISSFPVECSFDIPLPIKMIFSNDNIKFSYSVCITTSIGDPSEFVRNVSTVGDIIERSEVATEVCTKIKSAMMKIGEWVN
jgi:hypothetical protein